MTQRPAKSAHIAIIGCGFGGLEAAKALANADCRVTVVDKNNHHLFQPLLYQVATAGLAAPAVAAPIRHILRKQANAQVLLQTVERIDAAAKCLHFEDGTSMAFDALIVAPGASHSYFGNDAWEAHAPGLKTLADAHTIRQRILLAFENAEKTAAQNTLAQHAALRFAVIGAGPTGVEMAGTMAEIARHTLKREFRHINPAAAEVLLIEGGPRVLPSFTPDLSAKALAQLQKLGVTVRLNTRVTDIGPGHVQVLVNEQSERIDSVCTVWAAGVQASALAKTLGVPTDRAGRVVVDADLSIPNHPHVFVVGDMAAATSKGKPVPGVSPAAKQMGRRAAKNALAALAGKPTQAFSYRDYGNLATIGRKAAVVDLGKLRFSGLPAWLFWLLVHVYFLIGFRNRAIVMADWAWSYLSFARSARVFWQTERREAAAERETRKA